MSELIVVDHKEPSRAYADGMTCGAATARFSGAAAASIMDPGEGLSSAAGLIEAMYYPLGFPVRITSNNPSMLAAADESWSRFRPTFTTWPLELRMAVIPGKTRGLPGPPSFKLSGHRFINMADGANVVVADLQTGLALGWVTERTAACFPYLRYHFLEAAVLSMITTLRAVPIHAACVRVGRTGLLLCGDSGAGKSSLAYACARAGFTFVCDDAAYLPLEQSCRTIVGNCHQFRFRPAAAQLFPELAGREETPRATGKPSVEVPTAEWPELSTGHRARVEHIVFLNRHANGPHEIVPLAAASVRDWFRKCLLATERSRAAQHSALEHLLQARIYELRYSSLSWAVRQLRELAREEN